MAGQGRAGQVTAGHSTKSTVEQVTAEQGMEGSSGHGREKQATAGQGEVRAGDRALKAAGEGREMNNAGWAGLVKG
jgi:hypothetical protein